MKARIAFLLLSLIVSSPSLAQWSKMADRLLGNFPPSCCGFGHITYIDGRLWAGRSSLFVSNDTGKTWSMIKSFSSTISQIDFVDKFTGLVATTNGVYQTKDGGLTWEKILSSGDCYSAEYCGSKQNIIAISDYVGFFYSSDGGNSWNFYNPNGHPHFTLGNDDGSAFAFNDGGGGNLLLTSDKGNTYTSSGYIDGDSFFGARDSCEGAIYVVNEGGHVDNDGNGAIYKSTDEAKTWKKVGIRNIQYYSAGISASNNALYVQTTSNGIDRSTDQGETWVNINGPSNSIDTRTVCAIDDNLIVAVSADGSIWRTTNSGGDSVILAPQTVSLRFSSPTSVIDPTPNAEILVPISLQNATVKTGFELVVHYNHRSLEYLGTFAKNGDKIDQPDNSWAGRALIRFRPTDITVGSAMIAYSIFKVKWYEPFCDVVRVDSAIGRSSGCSPTTLEWIPTETIVGNFSGCILSVSDAIVHPLELTIRPNPTQGIFSFVGQGLTNASIIVLDVLGRVVFEREDFSLAETVNLSPEPAGMYYVRIQQGASVKTLQIVKR